jgi:bile acid:Na+ symporter, BASS family
LKKNIIYKIALAVSLISLLIALLMALNNNLETTGPLIIIFFVALAIAFRGSQHLKGFSYAVMIFAAVTTALSTPPI